jgi:hypothetical protein
VKIRSTRRKTVGSRPQYFQATMLIIENYVFTSMDPSGDHFSAANSTPAENTKHELSLNAAEQLRLAAKFCNHFILT